MGHSIGLDDNYFKPSENDVLEEYLTAVDWLTINEENRLKKQVKELTNKQDEIEVMKERYEQEMKDMRKEIVSMQESQKEIYDLFNDPAKLIEVLKGN
jgi:chromosome segregation ATPase